MKRNSLLYSAAAILLLGGSLLFTGCSDDDNKIPEKPEVEDKRKTTDEQFYANHFAKDILSYYYLWNEEIAKDITKLDPETNTDPEKTVNEIRYHQGNTPVDKWTSLIPDMDEFQSGVSGVSTTYGYQPITYLLSKEGKECVSAVAFVYKNSPASEAGLKRGDVITHINGQQLTTENFTELFNSSQITLSIAHLKSNGNKGNVLVPTGKDVTLHARKMYEDPVLLDSIYEFEGKKVGYLAYSSFDLTSIPKLIEVSKKFKAAGVKELILDFRYNGGGYVITENTMASMYVPEEAVNNHALFEIEKYNKLLTKEFQKQGKSTKTYLNTDNTYKDQKGTIVPVNTAGANIGLEKVYGLVTRYSASASEALLGGLMPYVDVELIGEPSHGKYCTGWMVAADGAYENGVPEPIKDWGIYVMVSVYQNADAETPCMPNGLTPDVEAEDNPMQPTQLGDVNEVMLQTALIRAGRPYDAEMKSRSSQTPTLEQVDGPHMFNFGKRILLPNQLPSLTK